VLRPRREEIEAYCPGGVEPWRDELGDDEPVDRAGVIAAARVQRLQDPGLPVDDATLERVADAVTDPDYRLPGLYLTNEEARDEVPEQIMDEVDDYLERHPGLSGGVRMGWLQGRHVVYVRVVRDFEEHRERLTSLDARVVVEQGVTSEADLYALTDRLFNEDREELRALGIDIAEAGPVPEEDGVVGIEIVAANREDAQRALTRRYGQLVRVEHCSPSWRAEMTRKFGSWSAEHDLLEVYYAIDHNGEQDERCDIDERDDAVTVTVVITHSIAGLSTLIGGFKAMQATLRLRAPLGDRQVIDGSCGQPRPSVASLRGRPEAQR
jgi:hypothetical protein